MRASGMEKIIPVAASVVIIVLVFRPHGLLGERAADKT